MRIFSRVKEAWYQLKCWAWHRYTTIKPRKLGHGFFDRCELLPYVMFEILADFVEKEEALDCHVDWGFDKGADHVDEHGYSPHSIVVNGVKKLVGQEIKDIHSWWVKKNYSTDNDCYREWHEFHKAHAVSEGDEWDKFDNLFSNTYDTPENQVKAKEIFNRCMNEEKRLEDEVMEMMHRMVAIHKYLWT